MPKNIDASLHVYFFTTFQKNSRFLMKEAAVKYYTMYVRISDTVILSVFSSYCVRYYRHQSDS